MIINAIKKFIKAYKEDMKKREQDIKRIEMYYSPLVTGKVYLPSVPDHVKKRGKRNA